MLVERPMETRKEGALVFADATGTITAVRTGL
jgi:hypothetical protein